MIKKIIKWIYKVVRSVLFTAILTTVAIYLLLYLLLSIPPVQDKIRGIAEKELTALLGSRIEIGGVAIYPFNEVVVSDVTLYTPEGDRCAGIRKLGAGISLQSLLADRKIVLTYAELIGLDANVTQPQEGGPLNIEFLIDLVRPKDKTKPPTRFDLELRSVVIRDCSGSFNRLWKPRRSDGAFDADHFRVTNLRADVTLPRLKNNDFLIDLRRLSMVLDGNTEIEKLAFYAHVTDHSVSVRDFMLRMPGTELTPADISFEFDGFGNIARSFSENDFQLVMVNNHITPSDLAHFYPPLAIIDYPVYIDADISGNIKSLDIAELQITAPGHGFTLETEGYLTDLDHPASLTATIEKIETEASASFISDVLTLLPPLPADATKIIHNAGDITLSGKGAVNNGSGNGSATLNLECTPGTVNIKGTLTGLARGVRKIAAEVDIPLFDVGALTGLKEIGTVSLTAHGDCEVGKGVLNGTADAEISQATFNGIQVNALSVFASKSGKEITAAIASEDPAATMTAGAAMVLDGDDTTCYAQIDIETLTPSLFGILKQYSDYTLSGHIEADLIGNNIDNVEGSLDISDLIFGGAEKALTLKSLHLDSEIYEEERSLNLLSDWIDIAASGDFVPSQLPAQVKGMVSTCMPTLIGGERPETIPDLRLDMEIKPESDIFTFLNLPARPLAEVKVKGILDRALGKGSVSVDAPYILKGKKSLIKDTRLNLDIDALNSTSSLRLLTLMPAKKGEAYLAARLHAHNDRLRADLGWKGKETDLYRGKISLDAEIEAEEGFRNPVVAVEILPSTFYINGAEWMIDNALLGYNDNTISVENLKVWHDDQFVEIEGTASQSADDILHVGLADIDLDFLFDTLEINHVTFGGTATGEVEGRSLLSGSPVATTKGLKVKNLSYNGAVLGDGDLVGTWHNDEKMVGIKADITNGGQPTARVDGGVYIGKDSLSFDFDANRVNVEFLQPFMSAFTSEIHGQATGHAKLYGTFSDVDMTGRLHADTLSMKVDQTNVTYYGSGDVIIDPGEIHIPAIRLYDRNGHSGVFSGELTHHYFHDAGFDFRLTGADRLLCYDTNERINPVWYGTIYCNGSATLHGRPGMVSIDVDMTTAPKTAFTFVLSDAQTAVDYTFLTFSDRRKEAIPKNTVDTIPPAVRELFAHLTDPVKEIPTVFALNLQVLTTPQADMTLVMDPASGDKIKARGGGPIKIGYDSYTDNMTMYGKYTLEEGIYNFTLQDIIIRDFNISPGSTISFNGNPMAAMLDISATYRVNTNLSDLDKSFSNDRDLNRTNVPVDAYLYVKGDLDSPEITFDLKLPTLTSDVERKVKSIISTDDMMSRQILYLLALNRFYTPEYMGTSSNGTGELASVASSTLSSQFSRMLGSLTDKVTVAPSFRSDRGDFTDFEMDVALSSRLLDNRLLLNGNFGYRDRRTSQTTFIGDFDIEYLLSRNGNLRLKAYNHFNDQNYYLKSSLTTQGIGIVYRRDFNNPFTFLRRKKKKTATATEEKRDTMPQENKQEKNQD